MTCLFRLIRDSFSRFRKSGATFAIVFIFPKATEFAGKDKNNPAHGKDRMPDLSMDSQSWTVRSTGNGRQFRNIPDIELPVNIKDCRSGTRKCHHKER